MQDIIYKPWQAILSEGFSSSAELLRFLEIPIEHAHTEAEHLFKTRVPRGFAKKMVRGNVRDPLLRQVLAVKEELISAESFIKDPLHEALHNPVPGLIHKYHGRVLLTVTGACAVNCRFCFRRHFPYDANNPGRQGWQAVFDYIRTNPSIHEVILSGGDPLLAPDTTLAFLFDALTDILHVKTLRIHTRLPVVLPERVDEAFCQLLDKQRFKKVVVLHSNHPNELGADVARACGALHEVGCVLLNQSVLLRGVNHDAETLVALSERLWACGVLPYYLHLLDKVEGASHFEVALSEGKQLVEFMRAHLPGYLVPRFVTEISGEKSKCHLS